jgi:hypothetical protein
MCTGCAPWWIAQVNKIAAVAQPRGLLWSVCSEESRPRATVPEITR